MKESRARKKRGKNKMRAGGIVPSPLLLYIDM
jgi:hypothetical protein